MDRRAVLPVALVALIVAMWALSDGVSSEDTPYGEGTPSVNDGSLGSVAQTDGTWTATPEEGDVFVGWFSDDGLVSPSSSVRGLDMDGVTAVFAESAYRHVSYPWICYGRTSEGTMSDIGTSQVFEADLPALDYYSSIYRTAHRTATEDEPMPTVSLQDDAAVEAAAEHLEPLLAGLTNLQQAQVVACFVQEIITYQSDKRQYGTVEFWATPIETVWSGYGDCEDTATLYVALALRLGLQAGFVAFDDPVMGHMGAAVGLAEGESVSGAVFHRDGVAWAYVETAIEDVWEVGRISSGYSITAGKFCPAYFDDGTYTGGYTHAIGPVSTGSYIVMYGRETVCKGAIAHEC